MRKMEEKFRERLPITQWPELERKMGIIGWPRMRIFHDPIEPVREESQEIESSEFNGQT